MTAAEKTALEAVSGVTETFRQAVQVLFDAGRKMFSAFFDRYPELREPYEIFPILEPYVIHRPFLKRSFPTYGRPSNGSRYDRRLVRSWMPPRL